MVFPGQLADALCLRALLEMMILVPHSGQCAAFVARRSYLQLGH